MLSSQTKSGIFYYLLNGKYLKEVTGIEDTKKEMNEKEILGEWLLKIKSIKLKKKKYWWKRSDCFIKKQ